MKALKTKGQRSSPLPASANSAQGADAVVGRIVSYITEHKLAAGQSLPAVRSLAKAWGLSPNTIRDGLLRAETLGLVQVRPRSGVVVREPDYASLADSLSNTLLPIIRRQDPDLVHLWDARTAIEIELAARAARRRLPEDLLLLRRWLQETWRLREDRPAFVEADEQFHLTIARIAGNPVMETFLDALLKILRPDRLQVLPSPRGRENTFKQHQAVYQAIADGDAERAASVMAEHCRNHIRALLSAGEATQLQPQKR